MTEKFKWKDKYSVKVSALDKQHKGFFDITNEIVDLLEQPESPFLKKNLILTIVKLGRYALYHLDFEEECMHRYQCKGCDGHEKRHNLYRERVMFYLQEVRKEETDIRQLAENVADFSQKWLSNHILKKDKEYVGCLEDKNIS